MKKSKDKKTSSKQPHTQLVRELFSELPQLQFDGNREIIIEGSKGVLEYSEELIRINTSNGLIGFHGRALNLKCISVSELIIDGFVTKVEFIV